MLQLRQVVKVFQSGEEQVHAIDRVSLSLECGEMLALQGPSGSGKSTLLLLAAAALAADSGSVSYQGQDLATLSERESAHYRLAHIGLISQNTHLMARVPAVENAATKLLLGGIPAAQGREQALEWLQRVGLGARAHRTPEELSGGERQRVAIARALAGNPQLILADEPTANLDTERSREIITVLRELAHEQNRAVLLVTHDAEAAEAADRTMHLRDGQLEGEPQTAPSP